MTGRSATTRTPKRRAKPGQNNFKVPATLEVPGQPADKAPRLPKVLETNADTLKIFLRLGRLQCTVEEVGAFFEVSKKTVELFMNAFPAARQALEIGKAGGKMSLRRLQWRSAKDGAVAMQIFLGKNLLGQSDRHEVEHSGSIDVAHARERVRGKLLSVAAASGPTTDPGGG